MVFERQRWMDAPKNDCLFIRWYNDPKTTKRVWTICCECGNNRLMLVGDYGLRCHSCGRYHARDAYLKLKEKLNRTMLHDIATRGLERIPQGAGGRRWGYRKMWNPVKRTFTDTPEHILKILARKLPLIRPKLSGVPIPLDKRIPLIIPNRETV